MSTVFEPPNSLPPADVREQAQQLVRAHGGRGTESRRNVLACLMTAGQALSHTEIEAALPDTVLDRVTLYRVLDWLVEQGLVHKVAVTGFDRAARFAYSQPARHHVHAHFQCVNCGKTLCLDQVAVPAFSVPKGIDVQGVSLAAFGRCSDCAIGTK